MFKITTTSKIKKMTKKLIIKIHCEINDWEDSEDLDTIELIKDSVDLALEGFNAKITNYNCIENT